MPSFYNLDDCLGGKSLTVQPLHNIQRVRPRDFLLAICGSWWGSNLHTTNQVEVTNEFVKTIGHIRANRLPEQLYVHR
jgi:hypothetical protein